MSTPPRPFQVVQISSTDSVEPWTGPGRAWSAREQGEYLFQLAGRKPWLLSVPVGLMDAIITVLDTLARLFPGLEVHPFFRTLIDARNIFIS